MENSHYHKLSRILWRVIVALLVLLAVYVSVGRMLVANLGAYREPVLQELNLRVPFNIEAQRVSGSWQSFTPFIVLTGLRLSLPGSERAPLELTEGRIGVDVLNSLRTRSLQVTRLVLDDLTLQGEIAADGSFRLSGLTGGGGEADVWLREFLLNVELVSLRRNLLQLQMPGGEVRELDLDLSLTRDGSDRRVEANLTSTRGMRITALANGVGNPFKPQLFAGDLYLNIDTTDLGAVRDVLARGGPVAWSEGELGIELWLSWNLGEASVKTRLEASDLLVRPREGDWELPLQRLALQANLARREDHWSVHASEVELVNAGGVLSLPRLQLDAWGQALRLRAVDVPLAPLNALLGEVDALPQNLRDVFSELDPAGQLSAVQLKVDDLAEPGANWRVEANFEELSAASYRGAPGATAVRGHAVLEPGGGQVIVDSRDLSLDFPKIYRRPLAFSEVYGSLDISWDNQMLRLTSGLMTARGEEGTAKVLFALDIPLVRGSGELNMDLLVGLRDSTPEYRAKYIPYVLNPTLLEWLDQSIGTGAIKEGAFLWRGSLARDATAKRTVQLAFNVDNTLINYHPEWPAVTLEEGVVFIDDARVSAWGDSGRVMDSAVTGLSVETWISEQGRVALAVAGAIDGSATNGLAIVRESPLSAIVGGAFDGWSAQGSLQADLDLLLELGEGAPPPVIEVHTRWRDVDLRIEPGKLPVQSLNGEFSYSSTQGFSSEGLNGVLWGRPINASMIQHHAEESGAYQPSSSELEVRVASDVEMTDLREWLGLVPLAFAQGTARANVGVRIAPNTPPLLTVDSELRGVRLDLPQPWQKDTAEAMQLHVEMPLSGVDRVIDLSLDEQLRLSLDVAGGALKGGSLGFRVLPARPQQGLFHISGHAADLHGEQWLDFVSTYLLQGNLLAAEATSGVEQAPQQNPDASSALRIHVDRLYANNLWFAGRQFEGVELSLDLNEQEWQAQLDMDWLRASASLDRASGEVTARTSHLDLSAAASIFPEQDAGAVNPDGKAASTLPDWPRVQVELSGLVLADRPLGRLEFTLASSAQELRATNIQGELAHLRLEAESPGSLTWRQGQAGDTRLQARLSFDDLGKSLEHFDYERILQTERGTVDVALNWPGAPQDFAIAAADGSLQIDIGSGNFLSAPSGAAGALRVVNILNLVDIVQRLSLSHMFESGIPFDAVRGEVYLHEGTIEVPQINVKGPSSFRFSGVSDVEAQSLDGELVATLPVAKNLPWVAALAASLPVAAGVFLVSQIFDKQMNRLSSAVYTIEGSWNDPQVSFDSMFDNNSGSTVLTTGPEGLEPVMVPGAEEALSQDPNSPAPPVTP